MQSSEGMAVKRPLESSQYYTMRKKNQAEYGTHIALRSSIALFEFLQRNRLKGY
ncbi:MAG: hypothetical protein WCT04_10625 [Planctomycetota bacterium]